MTKLKKVNAISGILNDLRDHIDSIRGLNLDRSKALKIKDVAERLDVRKAVFKEMPANALLTQMSDGYGIYVNPRGMSSLDLEEIYQSEGGDVWLPNHIRFTFAHEFAHILMECHYLRSEKSSHYFKGPPEDYMDLLEVACNRIAAEILVPNEELGHLLWNMVMPGEPIDLIRISDRFRVSLEVMLVCLGNQQRMLNLRYWKGIIYLMEFSSDGNWKKLKGFRSSLFSVADFICDDSSGSGYFLNRWHFNSESGFSEEVVQKLRGGVTIRCLIDRVWERSGTVRVLLSICEI